MTFYTLALKLKFPHVQAGQGVRIRSAAFDDLSTQKNVLVLQHYSNIMTFTSTSKLGNSLAKVADDRAGEKAALASDKNLRVTLTEVDKKHAGLATTSLKDLVTATGATSTFRT